MASQDRPRQPHAADIYKDLSEPDEIRVIKLAPGNSSTVDCELYVRPLPLASSPDPGMPGTGTSGYEAVSWCWGGAREDRKIRVRKGDRAYDFNVSANLESALKALRYSSQYRNLWVDAICIDQGNLKERNAQVPKMDRIYGRADNVCIWIGDEDRYSRMALRFINSNMLNLWNFDDLCADQTQTEHWNALINVMRRPWFSRRWVVQEIALARKGTLYCGSDSISWQNFADAISLFVHVETATHRLSDVMKTDQGFHNLPDFFGDVHALGAALLVDATRNLFRRSSDGRRKPLLSLEYLISKYSVFEASQYRDTIYAFLSIARDTKPHAVQQNYDAEELEEIRRVQKILQGRPRVEKILKEWGKRMSTMSEYEVNYALPVEAVYRGFIHFSILNSLKTDPIRPLDIICRPWAPRVQPENEQAGTSRQANGVAVFQAASDASDQQPRALPSWIPDLSEAPFAMVQLPGLGPRMERQNADPLVGLPYTGDRNYSAAGTRTLDPLQLYFKDRKDYYSMTVEGFILDQIAERDETCRLGNIPSTWPTFVGWNNKNEEPPEDFWRTLVADRGPLGQNPPTFYPRTCKEALNLLSQHNPLDTKKIIDHSRCTIVAEFLRRLQAVVWNRALMRTQHGKHLGLIPADARRGDEVCIFYGCSVPVVLRRVEKTEEQKKAEAEEDKEVEKEEAARLVQKTWRRHKVAREYIRAAAAAAAATVNGQLRPLNQRARGNTDIDASMNETGQQGRKRRRVAKSKSSKRRAALNIETNDHLESRNSVPLRHMRHLQASTTQPLAHQSQAQNPNQVDAPSQQSPLLPHHHGVPQVVPPKKRKRRHPDQNCYYKLIGECYVHRMMDGEAISWQNEKPKERMPTVFELR